MSLLKRLLGDKSASHARPAPVHDDPDSRSTTSAVRSAPRREVVHVVLRDTMRRHGIPTDWIECRTLSAAQGDKGAGTYVTLIVKHAQERLLGFVPAFQSSFLAELESFDPRASTWMLGLSWQFDFSQASAPLTQAPIGALRPAVQAAPQSPPMPGAIESQEGLEADLQALFAIRDAAIGQTAPEPRRAASSALPDQRGA